MLPALASPPLSIIIPTAGVGRRLRAHGAKALLTLSGETIIGRQLRILRAQFPQAEFIVVVGYEADKVLKALPPWVRVIENELYHENNVVRSLDLGLKSAPSKRVLVVWGDLVFNERAFQKLSLDRSFVLVDHKHMGRAEVGVNVSEKHATVFEYGLTIKWGQVVYLTSRELELARDFAPLHRMWFGFELLNSIIDSGGQFRVVEPPGGKIMDVDTIQDLERARKVE